jgi:uncharacterized membrane protein YuzA (DUF378 family)
MRTLDVIATILVLIGALNWGLVGLFQFDLVAAIFAEPNVVGGTWLLPRLVYVLVGLAAIYEIVAVRGLQHRWAPGHHATT